MSSLNLLAVSGRLTKDPELRYSSEGVPSARFSVAINGFKPADVTYLDCVAFRKTAEHVGSYFAKGSGIILQGRLQQSSWEGEDGKKRSKYEAIVDNVNFMDSKRAPSEEAEQGVQAGIGV